MPFRYVSPLFLLFILVTFSFPTRANEPASAYDRVIAKNEIVCGMLNIAPYSEIDPNTKEWKGFGIDLFRKAFATLDIKVVFKEVIPGNQVQDLNSGRIDTNCDDGPIVMSSGKFIEFSDPLYAIVVYPYVRIDETRFHARADFNKEGVQFTGIDGDLSTDLVQRLFPKAKLLSMPATTDASQLFLNVETKKADIIVVDPATFSAYNQSHQGKLNPLFTDKPLGIYKVGSSVKKGDLKMLGLVNQAIDNALAFGIVDEVLDSFDPEHKKLMRVRSKYAF